MLTILYNIILLTYETVQNVTCTNKLFDLLLTIIKFFNAFSDITNYYSEFRLGHKETMKYLETKQFKENIMYFKTINKNLYTAVVTLRT